MAQGTGSADAQGAGFSNGFVQRQRPWPMDVGSSGPPSAPAGLNARSTGNPTTVRQPDAGTYQSVPVGPDQLHIKLNGNTIGYVQRYIDSQHGPMYRAQLDDAAHRGHTSVSKTRSGFVGLADAAAHVVQAHRDIAQIESVGNWRPALDGGPNLPGH